MAQAIPLVNLVALLVEVLAAEEILVDLQAELLVEMLEVL
jgi:hypothetical protein